MQSHGILECQSRKEVLDPVQSPHVRRVRPREENSLFLKNFYLSIFRERGEEGEREREKHWFVGLLILCIHRLILTCAVIGDWTCNLAVSGRCSNQLSYSAKPELTMLNADSFWLSIIASFLLEFWECHILPRQDTCTRQLLPIQHTLSTCCMGSLGPASRRCDCLTT